MRERCDDLRAGCRLPAAGCRRAAAGIGLFVGSLMRLLDRVPRFAWRRKLRLDPESSGSRAAVPTVEREELQRQRDQALAERAAYLRQRDEALGERNEILRQRDEQIGVKNLLSERAAHHSHRADVVTRPAAATGDHLLLFLHLAKTGGMTLASILARNFATEESLQIDMAETNASALGIWSHRTIELTLERLQPSEAARLRVVWGHYRHGFQALLPKPCAVVTLLRDPVDRIVSAYYYSNESVGSLEILEQYHARKCYDIGFDNAMSRIISGRATLDPIAARQMPPRRTFPR
jgi:hypothetical protein